MFEGVDLFYDHVRSVIRTDGRFQRDVVKTGMTASFLAG